MWVQYTEAAKTLSHIPWSIPEDSQSLPKATCRFSIRVSLSSKRLPYIFIRQKKRSQIQPRKQGEGQEACGLTFLLTKKSHMMFAKIHRYARCVPSWNLSPITQSHHLPPHCHLFKSPAFYLHLLNTLPS